MEEKTRSSFGGTLGFVLAAAGSAVGLGNIWRFPYLAAKDGGGVFLVVYIVLALTFGFALLTTEIAIGRKTKQSPLTAYKCIQKKWGFVGWLASAVPLIIMPYYCAIGGWVLKYFLVFLTGNGTQAAQDGYFGGFITKQWEPIIMLAIFLAVAAFIVLRGVDKGIEASSKIIMPILLIMVIGIAIFALTLSHEDENGVVRTGLEGLKVYVIPNFDGMTLGKLFTVVVDALGQLFFSLSVAMGIMIAYGSYVKDDANLSKSINQIEIFDTIVAFLAGAMIIPAVYIFTGMDGMTQGPSLMFVSLPKVFEAMGPAGNVLGCIFFAMVLFAAITSAVSVMEAVVSSIMDAFHISRMKAGIFEWINAMVVGVIVCLGYNKLYIEVKMPTGDVGQILDIMDYISNSCLMPIVALLTCILVGWVLKPKTVIEEVEKNGEKMGRKRLYAAMVMVVAPILLVLILLRSMGILHLK
ncbi:MAG: sodium-dependent transporter [Wujia sp.]